MEPSTATLVVGDVVILRGSDGPKMTVIELYPSSIVQTAWFRTVGTDANGNPLYDGELFKHSFPESSLQKI